MWVCLSPLQGGGERVISDGFPTSLRVIVMGFCAAKREFWEFLLESWVSICHGQKVSLI